MRLLPPLEISKLCAILIDILKLQVNVVAPMLSMDQLYNFLGWEELPGTRDELEVLRIWIDELAPKNIKLQAPHHRFQVSVFRFQLLWLYFLTPDTRHLKPPPKLAFFTDKAIQLVASSQHMCRLPYSPFS